MLLTSKHRLKTIRSRACTYCCKPSREKKTDHSCGAPLIFASRIVKARAQLHNEREPGAETLNEVNRAEENRFRGCAVSARANWIIRRLERRRIDISPGSRESGSVLRVSRELLDRALSRKDDQRRSRRLNGYERRREVSIQGDVCNGACESCVLDFTIKRSWVKYDYSEQI